MSDDNENHFNKLVAKYEQCSVIPYYVTGGKEWLKFIGCYHHNFYVILYLQSPFKKIKFSQNLSKIFQQPYQLISKYLGNFLKMIAKLPLLGTYERI